MDEFISAKDLLNGKEEKLESNGSYIPLDDAAAYGEHGEYVQSGESCRIDLLKDHYAWMRGFINAFFGWPNDGKTGWLDYMKIVKSIRDGYKHCIYKHESMDSVIVDKKVHIKANRIYKNLAWIYSGKTWNRAFSEKYNTPMMTMEELQQALEFVTKHIMVICPKSRKYRLLKDDFMWMYEHHGFDSWEIDPWNVVQLDDTGRDDEKLINAFIDFKELSLLTNSVGNIVSHPRSLKDVKEKDGSYKVVNQFMQLGGQAWDTKMDGLYSIHRPFRHQDPRNLMVDFYNLKQKEAEIVGVNKGVVTDIEFDFIKKRYYFKGIDVIDGTIKGQQSRMPEQGNIFDTNSDPDKLPF